MFFSLQHCKQAYACLFPKIGFPPWSGHFWLLFLSLCLKGVASRSVLTMQGEVIATQTVVVKSNENILTYSIVVFTIKDCCL